MEMMVSDLKQVLMAISDHDGFDVAALVFGDFKEWLVLLGFGKF